MTHPNLPSPILPQRYRLWPSVEHALLGKGGASEVWRVQDEALGLLVALKVLRSEGARFQARLEREAVLASRVVHPNVIALHDVGRTPDNHPYLAFALASEGSMLEMSADPPPWPELMQYIIQLLRALGALHARGILHLDVKLSNLLLHREAQERELWLADLGVARALWDPEDNDPAVVGTVSYMSPERLVGRHQLWCPATDLFAVGAVVYRILTGRLPFPARDPTAALAERQKPPRTMKFREGYAVPEGLADVILPMLETELRARPELAADVIRALENLSPVGEPGPRSPIIKAGPTVPASFRPSLAPPPKALRRPRARRRLPQALSLLVHREIELVGREAELDQIWIAARAAMRSRRPQLLEISGPWGVGTTRLVQELTRFVEEAGIGEGLRLDYAVGDGPERGLRGAWRRIVPPGSPGEVYTREVANLIARDRGIPLAEAVQDARALGSWISPPKDAPRTNRSLARALFVEHLERRAWRGLSFLWIEDAHLADENDDCWPIIDMLLGRSAPVLVLLTTRVDHAAPSLSELRARYPEQVRTLSVAPLPVRAAETVVVAHLPLEPTLRERLARYSGGNARVIREVLSWWMRNNVLQETALTNEAGRIWTLIDRAPPLPETRKAFAMELWASVRADAGSRRAILSMALGAAGTPWDVLARVAGEALDRLVVDGLIDLERGAPMPVPPELTTVALGDPEVTLAELGDLHAALAEAWAAEGDDPAVAARVGVHRVEAGQLAEALAPLDRALRDSSRTWPVGQICDFARRTLSVAEQLGATEGPAWVHAAGVLADALWRQGDDEGAETVDLALQRLHLGAEEHLLTEAARARRAPAVTSVEVVVSTSGPSASRAEQHAARALRRTLRLEAEGAFDDLHEALALLPDPETECRAHLLRARLLALTDPMVAWHEALRTIEVARDNGLLRFEVLAWGLVAMPMAGLGHGEEAIERLRAGITRLETHGDRRAAAEARLHLAAALRAAGRDDEAQQLWAAAAQDPDPAFGTVLLGARESMAIQAVLDRRPFTILKLHPGEQRPPAAELAWTLLALLAGLMTGRSAATPDRALIPGALVLGIEGLVLLHGIGIELQRQGRDAEANAWEIDRLAACHAEGIEGALPLALLERMHRVRTPTRPA